MPSCILIYEPTGAIVGQGFTSADVAGEDWPVAPGQVALVVPAPLLNAETDYHVVAGEVLPRATMAPAISTPTIAADGLAECLLGDLPAPCVVTITGAVTAGPVEVTGGSLTLTSTQPGAITVSVRADPTHKPWETTIHAA